MGNKMEMIFTKEELGRITEGMKGNADVITVDLHGLSTKAARRLLLNLIVLDSDEKDICVIHGYIHGTSIKEMICNSLKHPKIAEVESVEGNYGRTVLKMRKAA